MDSLRPGTPTALASVVSPTREGLRSAPLVGRSERVSLAGLLRRIGLALGLAVAVGCTTPGVTPPQAGKAGGPAPRSAKARQSAERLPFAYEPLGVKNSCFVESVHFYDEYRRRQKSPGDAWARVLQWGNTEGDFKMGQGHAVTVFTHKDRLWFYDINYGVQPIDVAVERRGDIHDVSPKVFHHYPQYKPVFARYREDYHQENTAEKVKHLFYHKNPDVRDVTRVASELGKWRPIGVFEFDLKEGRKTVPAAGVAFVFGARVCVYFPRGGTHVSPPFAGSLDDLRYIGRVVKRLYPGSDNVRWQSGGYLLFPPREKKPGV